MGLRRKHPQAPWSRDRLRELPETLRALARACPTVRSELASYLRAGCTLDQALENSYQTLWRAYARSYAALHPGQVDSTTFAWPRSVEGRTATLQRLHDLGAELASQRAALGAPVEPGDLP